MIVNVDETHSYNIIMKFNCMYMHIDNETNTWELLFIRSPNILNASLSCQTTKKTPIVYTMELSGSSYVSLLGLYHRESILIEAADHDHINKCGYI